MNEDQGTQTETRRIEHFEDEIELMDLLLVIWKWKYLILAGTFALAIVVAIISYIQPTMYRTSIVLKPGVLEIDETDKIAYIDSPENIKALIENDLKHRILDDIKSSKRTKSSNLSDIRVDIPKGSSIINVSILSASLEDSTSILTNLVNAFSAEVSERTKFIQKKVENRLEENKYEFEILLFEEKETKTKIEKYEKKLSDIEAKIKFLKDSKDVSQNQESILAKLSLENDYLTTFQMYFSENEYAKLDLFELQKKIKKLSKEIEKLEKEKRNMQAIQIIQQPITKELNKINKIRRNFILASVVGFFTMLFLSFFLEYLNNYKKRVSNK